MLVVYVVLGGSAGIVGIPYSLMVGNVRRLYRVGMWIVRAGVRAAGIRVEVTGTEHVPVGRPCVYLCNHVSNLDPPVVLPALPGQCSVLLKKELMRIPILGYAMRMVKFVPVERGSRQAAARESVEAAAAALRDGLNILIFPEGTRSADGRLARFKKGPFYLAAQTGAPIVPVVLTGTAAMMPKGTLKITPGVARIRMLPAIDPGEFGSRDELMEAVHSAMAAALPGGMRPG